MILRLSIISITLKLLILSKELSYCQDEDRYNDFVHDPSAKVKRSVSEIPLGTSGFPRPIDIDPIPSGPRVTMPHISFRDMGRLVKQAVDAIDARFDNLEPSIYNSTRLFPNTPAWFMAASHKTKVVAKNISKIALITEEATKYMSQEFSLNKDQITYGLPTADVRGTILASECPVEVDFPCQPRKFRAFNGYCNNVQNPRWGNSNTRYLRFLPANYGDGVSVPRQAISGEFLPSARAISLTLHAEKNDPHNYTTAIAITFAQFLFHDLSHTPQMAGFIGQRLRCCGVNFEHFHPECYPIRLPDNDPIHSTVKEKCQEYVRSGTSPRTGCTLGPREQINQVTSFIDGSVLYGSSKEESDGLRSFNKGLLKGQRSFNGGYILSAADPENFVDCKSSNQGHRCFKSGDVRVNENVGLTAMHQLFAREHNRITTELSKLNNHWNDEQLFQETRRIIGAELQHITYNEFLPIVVGESILSKYGLKSQPSGFFTGYDININSGLANSVASAALNFVASMIPNNLEYYSKGKLLNKKSIADTFYAPFDLYDSRKFSQIIEGLTKSHAQNEDMSIVDAMTNRMFMNEKIGIGLDIAAHIIQQGRDHGIASYNRWRSFCGLPKAKKFSDFSDVMSPANIKVIEAVYKNVDDVDLFSGGLAEKPNKGAIVGPTFGCLLGRQFHYLRRGDRYWYENDIPPSAFSKEQLYELRKSSLARIICDNAEGVVNSQPKVMLQGDPFLNADMPCSGKNVPTIDLRKWKTASPNFVVPDKILQNSIERAKRDIGDMRSSEVNLWTKRKGADPKGPIGSAYAFSKPKQQAVEISNTSFILQFASARFMNNFLGDKIGRRSTRTANGQLKDLESGSVSPNTINELMDVLPEIDVSDIMEIPNVFSCDEQTLPCDHTSRFRTATGWCNNLNNPEWGKSFRAKSRLMRPSYDDGLSKPRSMSVTGRKLPSPRLVSTNMHNDVSAPHVRYTLIVMQWGQFIDHDTIFTPVNKGFQDSILDCKRCDSQHTIHPECFPIEIPQNDPFFPPINISSGQPFCLPLTRSMPGQLTLGYRDQMNQVTTYIDASHTYGSDKCEQEKLRTFKGGKLVETRNPLGGKALLPTDDKNHECKSPSGSCFTGGDTRAAEQPGLAAVHTLFMREHNRIVEELKKLNPHWNDEHLFQQGRRIVTAINQHISYNEWVPRVLGWNAVNLYHLDLVPEGYFEGYDKYCDATVLNEFGIAFRFGHTLLKPTFERMDGRFAKRDPPVKLSNHFFNTDILYQPGMIDEMMRGLTTVSIETFDQFLTAEVTNHLFEEKEIPFSGMDLAALNIQRGRDHGLQSYNEYRRLCNLSYAHDFDDLRREVPRPIIERLKRTFDHVNDIDLFSGGLIETPLHGGLVGPTFGCVMGMQFNKLRRCDRFWYENSDPLVRFTEAQLTEIRKVTLSKILCDNCENVLSVQRSAFDLPDPFLNPRIKCKETPGINLELWRETKSCNVGPSEITVGGADRISPCVMCTCTKEGPVCQSLKIDNCFHLAQSYTPEDILHDHVCKVQCAFAFRAFPSVGSNNLAARQS